MRFIYLKSLKSNNFGQFAFVFYIFVIWKSKKQQEQEQERKQQQCQQLASISISISMERTDKKNHTYIVSNRLDCFDVSIGLHNFFRPIIIAHVVEHFWTDAVIKHLIRSMTYTVCFCVRWLILKIVVMHTAKYQNKRIFTSQIKWWR